MEDTHDLSAPGALDPLLEKLIRRATPREALEFFRIANDEERLRVWRFIHWKLAHAQAEDWTPEERREIKHWFGVEMLDGPGPVGR
jgi:hypothetical protein